MIIVTDSAAHELRQILAAHATGPDQVLRVDDASEGLSLELGWATEEDEVVQCQGESILHIGPEVSLAFADVDIFIDCLDTPEGPQLTLYSGHEVSLEELQAGCDCGCHDNDQHEHAN